MGSITDATILHHVCIILVLLWILNSFNYSHPIYYFLSLLYLYLVHEGYVSKLKRKIQFEERRDSMKRRVLSDSETVRWLNYAIEKMWLICMEEIVSQRILLPIVPWFLQKYKPWTVQLSENLRKDVGAEFLQIEGVLVQVYVNPGEKDAEVQHLYLGRSPPIFTEMRVLPHSNGDDHLVLELGMSFRTADDMSAILAVKLRRRLGFGMWAKLHLLGMHVEGKVLVGVKFLRKWPFIGRLRVCFSGPPYFQMTVKPIFTHGLDVTELPGIAGWIDNLLALVFEQTLVEPNMLVVDVEKFVSPQPENWFSVDAKEPIAHAIVEVIEAFEMNPSDLNGLADPYVKGQLGSFRFRTRIQKKTLAPIWQEEFKIPITTWESENVLAIEVRDKDHLFDDMMGDCSLNINELRDGQRHDIWLPLQNIKMGRLHLAVTVLEDNKKETEPSPDDSDKFEPINVEGQSETGIWIHHPGNEVAQIWEPRKGKTRHLDTHHLSCEVKRETINSRRSFKSVPPISIPNDGSNTDENCDTCKSDTNTSVRRGLRKIGSVFRKTMRPDGKFDFLQEPEPSPRDNIRAVNNKEVGVKLIVNDIAAAPSMQSPKGDGNLFLNESGPESPGNVKDMAKSMLKQAGKSARSLKVALSRKASRKFQADTAFTPTNKESPLESNSSVSSTEVAPSLANTSDNSSFRSGDSKIVSPKDSSVQTPKE